MNDRCSDYHIYKMYVRGKAAVRGIYIDSSVEDAVASTLQSADSIAIIVGFDIEEDWLPTSVQGHKLGEWRNREVFRAEKGDMDPLSFAIIRRSNHYPNDPNLYSTVYLTTERLESARAIRMG